jgi:predicted metal-dependent phosphoesterase TrpH
MPRFDHHIHTSRYSPDSIIDPFELVEIAAEHGLDGVVITEHDEAWPEDELDELRARAGDLVVLSGVEVSAREGHFLVYGLSYEQFGEAEAGIALADLVPLVRRCGGAIVAAHPYRWGQDFDEILARVGPVFDGLELVSNNVTPDLRPLIEGAARAYRLRTTGSSDAHEPRVVGCYCTSFSSPIRSMPEFVAAIRSGSFHPAHRPGARLVSGPVDLQA